jgi:hypothetical protein
VTDNDSAATSRKAAPKVSRAASRAAQIKAEAAKYRLSVTAKVSQIDEARARALNDRRPPDRYGRAYVSVRAEPVPGTNKFRNLNHPSLPRQAKTAAKAAEVKAEAAKSKTRKPARLRTGQQDQPRTPGTHP